MIDGQCLDEAAGPAPVWYVDDDHQNAHLLNYFALATSFSPMHGPVPDEPGHGNLGLDLLLIPPLSCDRRLVLSRTKTEDTNRTPVAPRPRLGFTLPRLGPVAIYGGLGYVPPVTLFGTRNVIASGEIGVGLPLESGLAFGVRYHYTLLKTVADIATAFEIGGPAVDDFYSGSTFGADALAGYDAGPIDPYFSVGFTDVSTFFYIGDDGVVTNNPFPYFGLTGSLGAQVRFGRFDGAAEFYAAPGVLYTGRLRLAVAI